jgi:hypothetical protein
VNQHELPTSNRIGTPRPPIAIGRPEFDEACDALASADVPLKADRDQAWRDLSGWRVNYDTPLLYLAELVTAALCPLDCRPVTRGTGADSAVEMGVAAHHTSRQDRIAFLISARLHIFDATGGPTSR